MDAQDPIDLHPVHHLFPHIPDNVFDALVKKDIDVLIGMNFFSLHPSGGQGRNCVDNIRVLHSKFSKGWIVAGTHQDIQSSTPILTRSALSIVKGFRVEIKPELSVDFWEGENMGVLSPKRCCRCMQCSECKDSALIHSRNEQDELELLQKSVQIENGQLKVSYPFIKNPDCLPNNRSMVVSMAQKLENRLVKKGLSEKYNDEFKQYMERHNRTRVNKSC